ncbi:hypothetical protein CYMTET_46902 [Cymbomonas tetramitiformis]|uniref:Very-long-chain (3R)-3-hydroxyacyl-CoA dehydratase n=1 Tax=Cymbomonas tetramitiformis TaxID=36881 RepID=A0AAE0EWP4_9CHLO|nr:hypothetical protein CYMTET_46902 [Cymbomonas tetramitiformis]
METCTLSLPQSKDFTSQAACQARQTWTSPRRNSGLVSLWLTLYNLLNSAGWLYVSWHLIYGVCTQGLLSFRNTWPALGGTTWRLQLLVVLDVAHAALGLWGDHPTIPLHRRVWCKVGHRTELFITIWLVEDQMLSHWSWGPLLASWALADVFRFPFYALSSMGVRVSWLTRLRYSTCIIQWPFNLLAEANFIASAFVPLRGLAGGPLLSYAWVAIAFQLRNAWAFYASYSKLLAARRVHTGQPSSKNVTD